MKRYNLERDGYLESKIYEYPSHEILENDIAQSKLKENELKFYFVLDKYVYEEVDTETNESKIEFDSGFYLKKYDLTFSGDDLQYILEFAIRTFSFHTLILGELLPFIAIGITKKTKATIPQIRLTPREDFILLRVREKWTFLENDLEILEKNIEPSSSLQKALIWFTRAKLSNTRIETFMNYYRCLEELSRDFHEKIGKEFDDFVKRKIPRFDGKIRKTFAKFQRPDSNSFEAFLMLNNIEHEIISKIQSFRNEQIAHGNDYKIEYNMNLIKTINEMEIFTKGIINQEIKKMKLEGLKNPDFLYDYYITISPSRRKIVLSDDYDLHYLIKEMRVNNADGLISSSGLGRIDEKDISSSIMLEKIEHITIDEELCKKLIKNFGKIIEY